jgi:hypothetical protein
MRIRPARGHRLPSAAPTHPWMVGASIGPDRYRIFAITCPFHGNTGWRWIRDHDPDGWAEAVEFDRAIRSGYPRATDQGRELRGQYFLHCLCLPMDQVDLDASTKSRSDKHLRLISAGDADSVKEDGDPDGRSPWSCRSGESAPAVTVRARYGCHECAARVPRTDHCPRARSQKKLNRPDERRDSMPNSLSRSTYSGSECLGTAQPVHCAAESSAERVSSTWSLPAGYDGLVGSDATEESRSVTGQPGDDSVQLSFTPSQAAQLLQVRESWLRRRAARRLVPCTFLGKHLRFSRDDLKSIIACAARPADTGPATRSRPSRTDRRTRSRDHHA